MVPSLMGLGLFPQDKNGARGQPSRKALGSAPWEPGMDLMISNQEELQVTKEKITRIA